MLEQAFEFSKYKGKSWKGQIEAANMQI